jgi:hypothetical protein
MNMTQVKSKDLRPIIKATFPNYRKRTVYVKVTEKVTLRDLNWSGGTRSEYRACTIDGRPIENKVNMSGPAPWNNPYEGKEIDLPVGALIVEGGHFCGKQRTLYINVHPDNMPKLIAN